MIRLLLIDDQPAVRRGLRMRLALESDITVVGEAGDSLTGLSLAARLRPDVVLLDVEMPGMDGIAATATLRAVAPDIAVVALSVYDEKGTRRRAEEAGAAAFIGKHSCGEDLLAAIRRVAHGASGQMAERTAPPKDGDTGGPFVRCEIQGSEV
jgi:two-component system response regulator DesR